MFSRILVKLVDEAIVPAITLLVVRIASVVLVSKYLNLVFNISKTGFVFQNEADFVVVNSYSALAMVCVNAIGVLYVLYKSHFFHDSHIKPHTAAKLFSLRLSSFIQTSFDVYSRGAIWLSYSYLLLLASAIMVYFGLVFPYVLVVSLILTVISTYLFVVDVEREIKACGRAEDDDIAGEVVLTWEAEEMEDV